MPTPVGFDPSTYNSSSVGSFTLGATYEYNGREFRYIQFLDAVAAANGQVVEWASTTNYFVSPDRAGGSSLGRQPAGVMVGTITQNYYGFILTRGRHTAVLDAANGCTAGKQLTTHATTDGNALNKTNLYDATFGTCVVSGSGGVCTVEVFV